MKIRVYIFFALFLVISTSGIAQQQPSFMQYMYNTLTINPAYAGYHRSPVFNLSGNSQFTGINGNPTSAVLSFHGNALNEKVGLGAMISSDKIGVTSTTGITGSYSYSLISRNRNSYTSWGFIPHVLTLGIQAGVNIYKEDLTELDGNNDPNFAEDLNMVVPTFGFGLYYSKDSYYFGLSFPQLLNAKIGSDKSRLNIYRHIYLNSGKQFSFGKNNIFDLSTLIKYVQGAPMQIDLNGIVTMNDLVNLGFGYSSASTMNFMVGLNVDKSFRFGYFYGHPMGNSLKNYGGKHEIMLMLKVIGK